MDLLQRLQARQAPLLRLPAPEPPEDEMDMAEKHIFSGDDLARMAARMAGALARLGVRPAAGRAVTLAQPVYSLETVMLWLAAVLTGTDVHVLPDAAEKLPEQAGLLVCPPPEKARWQPAAARAGVKVATLGGHWEGSFFMLQMVQQKAAHDLPLAQAQGRTWFAGDAAGLELPALLEQAEALAVRHELRQASAFLVSLPVFDAPGMLALALAALLQADAPLYWLAPARRAAALAAPEELPEMPEGVAVLGDAGFMDMLAASGAGQAVLRRGRCISVGADDA